MNSCTTMAKIPTKQPYGKRLEPQIAILNQVKETFSGLRCTDKNTLQVFQKGVIISCNSMHALYTKLVEKYKISYILTHRLNQDSLEIFFSQVGGFLYKSNSQSKLFCSCRYRPEVVYMTTCLPLMLYTELEWYSWEKIQELFSQILISNIMRD